MLIKYQIYAFIIAVANPNGSSSWIRWQRRFIQISNRLDEVPTPCYRPHHPALYAKAEETISNMSKANYFYITAYPEYGGYRIEHDPTFTAYIAASQTVTPTSTQTPTTRQPKNEGIVIIIIAVVSAALAVTIFLLKRKPKPVA